LHNILLIEDDETLRFTLERALSNTGSKIVACESFAEALSTLQTTVFDLILTDVHLGEESGIDLVEHARADGFEGGIIVMTAYANVDDAVRAMKLGADDYLAKPIRIDELTLLIDRVIEHRQQSRQLRLYKRIDQAKNDYERPLGESTPWKNALSLAERLAQIPVVNRSSDLGTETGGALPTILITGQTGAGKGVIARHIHASSPTPSSPFVHVNCTALPASLIEGELFGHEKGAFTDAKATREGLFEMADGGTIFLDEIGDLPLSLQAKLLSVLEHGRLRRVGATREHTVRLRVLAATNKDLEQMVRDGSFREDLLFRINAFTIQIPSLRERGADAGLIAQSMLARLRREYGQPTATLEPAALEAIASHPWPGNVRELFNCVQRAAMLSESNEISATDLGLGPRRAKSLSTSRSEQQDLRFDFESGIHSANEVEKQLMLQALEHTNGNVSKAARLIGMQRSSFRYRIERYNINAEQETSK
jgi:DNA-binding NtrC family response regulator